MDDEMQNQPAESGEGMESQEAPMPGGEEQMGGEEQSAEGGTSEEASSM